LPVNQNPKVPALEVVKAWWKNSCSLESRQGRIELGFVVRPQMGYFWHLKTYSVLSCSIYFKLFYFLGTWPSPGKVENCCSNNSSSIGNQKFYLTDVRIEGLSFPVDGMLL